MDLMPPDVDRRLLTLFPDPAERDEARRLIESLWSRQLSVQSSTAVTLGVAAEQLARSILVLSAGDLTVMREIFTSNFWGDPRDVVTAAEKKSGCPGHYGTAPFGEGK